MGNYEELVKRLRDAATMSDALSVLLPNAGGNAVAKLHRDAADAIEAQDRHILTLQHEMMAEAESHIALVERLNKQIEELQKNVAYWQAQLTKSMCGETLAELKKPRWIPVTERLPSENGFYLCLYSHNHPGGVAMDEGLSILQWFCGRWNLNEIYTVTHWMPIPEAPKEEC